MLARTQNGTSMDPDWPWTAGNWHQKSLYISLAKTEKRKKMLSFQNIFWNFETSASLYITTKVWFSTYFWSNFEFQKSLIQ